MENLEWFDSLPENEKRDYLEEFTHEIDDLYFYSTIEELLNESGMTPKEAFDLAYQNPDANPEYYGEEPVGFVLETDDNLTVLFDYDDYIAMVKDFYPDDFNIYLETVREELGEKGE